LLLLALPLVLARFVPSDDAADDRAGDSVMTRIMAGGAADDSALQAASGVGGTGDRNHGEDQGGCGDGDMKSCHLDDPFWLVQLLS
jgi:hypothetical protein